ncbi:unnamed protein product [Oikopleura dioica]|uniref:Glucosidase 2 subunit beta n=1 Tax=Oikopleura dioica TaxID=34765 RepID=E4X9H4_OIKDI|nr:unnamed protein product [Oikopleura dioica]
MKLLLPFLTAVFASDRIRGVSITRQALYPPGTHFTCLDGSKKIPRAQVNDDFCDCADESDEPGTSACPNGRFHCPNAGFAPQNILSSRVNDMICDCCDGSDEWGGFVDCPNTCKEEYLAAHAEKIEAQKAQAQGFEKRQDLVDEAKLQKISDEEELAAAEPEIQELQKIKDEADKLKNEAEELETKVNEELEAVKNKKIVDRAATYSEEDISEIAFNHLDANKNGEIVVYEITSQKYLDPKPETSSFTTKEAKEVMKQKDKLYLEDFRAEIWPEIKEKILAKLERAMDEWDRKIDEANKPDEPKEPEQVAEVDQETVDYSEESLDAMEEELDEQEDYNDALEPVNHNDELSDEHQKIFDAAKASRKVFDDADRNLREAESKISEIKERSKRDFGPDDVFRSMNKVCFEFKTTEYIYTLCPYDKCEQKPVNGGSGTKLGSWEGFENDFNEMHFTNGVKCWNGPNRSAVIKLSCGVENVVLSVTEPNRCEYEYKFETPAVCTKPEPVPDHDEL